MAQGRMNVAPNKIKRENMYVVIFHVDICSMLSLRIFVYLDIVKKVGAF